MRKTAASILPHSDHLLIAERKLDEDKPVHRYQHDIVDRHVEKDEYDQTTGIWCGRWHRVETHQLHRTLSISTHINRSVRERLRRGMKAGCWYSLCLMVLAMMRTLAGTHTST